MHLGVAVEAVKRRKGADRNTWGRYVTSSLGDTTHMALPPRSPLSFAWLPSASCLDPHAGAGAGRYKDLDSNGNASHTSPEEERKGRSWQHPRRR
jgi:hypothetical protein